MNEPVRLAEAVGRRVREIRARHGWTQDELARTLRGHGLNWGRSALAKLERGERETLTVEQLVILALSLPVPPAELFAGPERIALAPRVSIRADALASAFKGELPSTDDVDAPIWDELAAQMEGLAREYAHRERVWPELTDADHQIAQMIAAERRDAEVGAARRLGVPLIELSRAAQALWSRSLTGERDRRIAELEPEASGDRLRALRGHVSRGLLFEIKKEIKRRGMRTG